VRGFEKAVERESALAPARARKA